MLGPLTRELVEKRVQLVLAKIVRLVKGAVR